MSRVISRRELLKVVGGAILTMPLLYACQPKAVAPTAQPKAEQTKVEKPATQPPAPKEKPKLRVTLWAEQSGEGRTWPKDRALKWVEEKGIADVEIEMVSYNEMAAKQLTAVAAGTLWDVMFNNNRWGPYSAYKGVFLWLDDLVDANKTDLSDFFPAAVEGCRLEGKLYGLPCEVNTGNQNIVYYNKDLLAKFGVSEPTDDWSFQDYAEMAAKCTDRDNRIFGTDLLPSNYYDFSTYARSWGGDVLDKEAKNFTLTTDPKTAEAMKAIVELRTKYKAAPSRDESQGLNFYAGQMAIRMWGSYGVVQTKVNVGDKFKWDIVLGPKGPTGLRGYSLFILMQSIGATTKYPQEAYSLLEYLTSQETAMWSFVNQGQPTARASVMGSKEAQEQHSIWARISAWLTDGVNQGPLPMPWNLRHFELNDTWKNVALELMYGEVPFEQGMDHVQEECQKIVALPRS